MSSARRLIFLLASFLGVFFLLHWSLVIGNWKLEIPPVRAVEGTLNVTATTASYSGTMTQAGNQPIRTAFGPLRLDYKSGPNSWTTGFLIREGDGNVSIGANITSADFNSNSKLRVLGIVESTNGGFKFPDGTTQTSAASGNVSGWTDGGANVYTTTSSDSVGIGTTAPGVKLDIAGATKLSEYNALTYTDTDGSSINSQAMLLGENATVYAGDANTSGILYGAILSPKISSTNVNYYTTATGLLSQPRIISSDTGARVTVNGAIINAVRRNANDTSTFAGNTTAALFTRSGNHTLLPSNVVTGGATGVNSTIINYNGTITTAYGLRAGAFVGLAGQNVNPVIGTYYGLMLNSPTLANGGTITNNYGIYSQDTTAINYFGGNVGIGTTAPGAKLEVAGNINSSTGALQTAGVTRIANDGVGTFAAGTTIGGSGIPGGSGLNSVQTFSSSGTWTKPSGVTKVIVEVQGGGGGGGGGNGIYDGAIAGGAGGSGGAGGYCRKFIDVSAISSVTVTVGGAGSAGAAGHNGQVSGTGGTGGTSSFGAHCSATGGTGGGPGIRAYQGGSGGGRGAGGTASGGDINLTGNVGFPGKTAGNGGTEGGTGLKGILNGDAGDGGAGSWSTWGSAGSAGTAGTIVVWEYK